MFASGWLEYCLLLMLNAARVGSHFPWLSLKGDVLMKKIHIGMLAVAALAFSTSAVAIPVPVPEPGTFGLLAMGLAGVFAVRLIKRKK